MSNVTQWSRMVTLVCYTTCHKVTQGARDHFSLHKPHRTKIEPAGTLFFYPLRNSNRLPSETCAKTIRSPSAQCCQRNSRGERVTHITRWFACGMKVPISFSVDCSSEVHEEGLGGGTDHLPISWGSLVTVVHAFVVPLAIHMIRP